MTPAQPDPGFSAAAAAIDADRDAAFARLKTANARGLDAAAADDMINSMKALDERTESLRKRYFPKSARLIIALGMASVSSPQGRRSHIVWRAPEQASE